MRQQNDQAKQNLETIAKLVKKYQDIGKVRYKGYNYTENAALCLFIIETVAWFETSNDELYTKLYQELDTYIASFGRARDEEDVLPQIKEIVLTGLQNYLDEQIDNRNMINYLVSKYRDRAETFRRERTRAIFETGLEGRSGEKALALNLLEYIYDQEVNFIIDPFDGSGGIEFILRGMGGKSIIMNVAYIPENASRKEIVESINSGLSYITKLCGQNDEPEGFLVIFQDTAKQINLPLSENDGLYYLSRNGRTIYITFVNIADIKDSDKGNKTREINIGSEDLVPDAII